MRIVKIEAFENGAHDNNESDSTLTVPAGWAIIPDSMTIPDTFPFVSIEVDGQTVVNMTAGTMPKPEPAEPDEITQTQIALAELAETESAHDLENKLALAELAETIGGTSNG